MATGNGVLKPGFFVQRSVALVATAGTKTLALLQLDYMVQGRYGAAAVISFVVIAMSTGLALLARIFGLRIGIRD